MNSRRAFAGLLACAIGLVIAGASVASTPGHLVISQVYGGGGNTGAPYTHDYVELYNPTAAAISLDGLSIQYASAAGTGNFGANSGQLTELSGSVAPGGYYLVQQGAGAGSGVALPTPDHVDPTPINMSGTDGKVALVTGTSSLGCNGSSGQPCTTEARARIVDLVGYGTANFFEGSAAAPRLSNTTAAFRADGGKVDTDDNAADFSAAAPDPRNSSVVTGTAKVVVSQVYGGGGNSGATYTHDFIELFNAGTAPADLSGWSVQYASTAGTTWQVTGLSGTIQPGGYYLVQQAAGAGGTTPLPTPDASGSIAMSASNGKVALVNQSAPLSGSCPLGSTVVDLVGFGTANCFEGSGATPGLVNTTAALRKNNGCTDTDDNAADFVTSAPAPRNSNSTPHACGETSAALSIDDVSAAEGNSGTTAFTFTVSLSQPAAAGGVTFDVATADGTATTADNDYQAGALAGQTIAAGSSSYSFTVSVNGDTVPEDDETFFVNLTNVVGATVADGQGLGRILNDDVDCTAPYTPIYAIQGSGATAAITGTVTTQGVVVGDFEGSSGMQGFYLQDVAGDGNPETSDGIFVFTGAADTVSAGQVVGVTGFARERFNQTAINGSNADNAAVTTIAECGTPTSVLPTDVTMPFDAADSLERYEGMLVRFPQSLVIAEYFNYERFGELVLGLPLEGESRPFTPTAVAEPGGPAIARLLANVQRRITLDDGLGIQNPDLIRHPNGGAFSLENRFRGGDTVANAVGVLGFDFNLYRIHPTAPADYTAVNLRPEAPAPVGGRVQVAGMNMLNFFITGDYPTGNPLDNKCGPAQNVECRGHDTDQPEEFERQRIKLVAALAALDADVVGVNEIENTTGVDPLGDPQGIVPGLNAMLSAGTYDSIDTGTIGTDAIKVGLIYKPAVVKPVGEFALLTSAVDPRFDDSRSRPALAQTFEELATGARFTVVVNHLKSKGSACAGDPDTGDGQGHCNLTRTAAAEALVDWVKSDPTGSGDPDFLFVGDLNAYDKEDPIDVLREAGYTDLVHAFNGEYAYSYVFDGMAGYLDHALSNASLTPQVKGVTEWHINADEPDVLDYDTTFKPPAQDALYEPNAFRSSDHDPVLVGLDLDTTYADLRRMIRDWVTKPGVAASMIAKLDAAEAAEARGDTHAKNGILGALANELRAQSGKSITAERAGILSGLVSAL